MKSKYEKKKMPPRNVKLYVVVTHLLQNGGRYEQVRITNNLKKRFMEEAEIIINVGDLKMEKDRHRNYSIPYNESEVAVSYLDRLSLRNADVKKLWNDIKNESVEASANIAFDGLDNSDNSST